MTRPARARVVGNFDGAKEATVTMNRAAGLLTVRPIRRRRIFELPLSVVAEMVMWRVVKAELFKAKMAKGKERRARRRGR